MVTENPRQPRFSHEEWIDQLSQFWVTFKEFLIWHKHRQGKEDAILGKKVIF